MKNKKRAIYLTKEKFPRQHDQNHEPTQSEISDSARKLRQAMLLDGASANMITFIELEEK